MIAFKPALSGSKTILRRSKESEDMNNCLEAKKQWVGLGQTIAIKNDRGKTFQRGAESERSGFWVDFNIC